MDITKGFADPTLEQDGVWIDYRDDSKVKIARLGNARFQKTYDLKMKPLRRRERKGELDSQIQTRVLCECLADTVLLDWKGFEQDGKVFNHTGKRAYDLLMRSIDFRNEITELAAEEEHFKQAFEEDSAKN